MAQRTTCKTLLILLVSICLFFQSRYSFVYYTPESGNHLELAEAAGHLLSELHLYSLGLELPLPQPPWLTGALRLPGCLAPDGSEGGGGRSDERGNERTDRLGGSRVNERTILFSESE